MSSLVIRDLHVTVEAEGEALEILSGVNLTVKNLKVVAVDPEQNVLLVRGAIPGPVNGLVIVKKREG